MIGGRRRTSAYYRASVGERKLWDVGIPERYWCVERSQFDFRAFNVDDRRCEREQQQAAITSMLEQDGFSSNCVVGIGAEPTDDLALGLASLLVRSALERGLQAQLVDVARAHLWPNDPVPEYDVVLFHNVTTESDGQRLRHVRDLLRAFEGCFRGVVFGGSDPAEFFDTKLRLHLDVPLYVQGPSGRNRLVRRKRSV